uniref:Antitoxin n=1 Tax=Candidatus Caldatribacterium saccharofermentans TaxID=1454753 RepID=A0A7V4TGK9_9BACT
MNVRYLALAERIRGEIPELERVAQKALAAWTKAQKTPEESAYLDSVALNLHGFYSGLERLFELVARHIDGVMPDEKTWHRDLLRRMAKDIAGVRPAVISEGTASALDTFRRFRHLVRNVYAMSLVPERMVGLMSVLPDLWSTLREELLAFADFLEALDQATEEAGKPPDENA